jgi:hypothetical protein
MEQTNKLKALEEKFEMAKQAISSGQEVDVFSDYYAQDEKFVFRIEIKKNERKFF